MLNIYKNKNILITGGTGSFGSTFVNKISKQKFNKLFILSRDEDKQHTLRLNYSKFKNIHLVLGDVRDKSSIHKWFDNIDIVIHCAALKQVPSCEYHPSEAFKTNVIGTENVMNCAIEKKVKKFIFLSTDKAVYPINAMGFTKALAEKIVISRSRDLTKNNDTKLLILRYGNVIASRGSVVRTLVNQLLNNKTLTLTSKQMTRFIMSLDDAIDLLNYALKFGKQGELFVRKTPSIKIIDLIISLKKIFNKKNKIKIIGIRQGEKLHETLISEEESKNCVSKKKFFIIKPNQKNLNYEIYFSKGNKRKKNINVYSSNNQPVISITKLIEILKKEVFIKENLD